MRVSSPEFENAGRIPTRYTCDGAGISPPLVFETVPDGALSLALVMDDPDAPAGTFVHWTVWNVDPAAGGIAADSVPAGAVGGSNTAGRVAYHPPCPPSGAHRYFFKLYALDATLQLPAGSSRAQLDEAMGPHVIEMSEFHGVYNRSW